MEQPAPPRSKGTTSRSAQTRRMVVLGAGALVVLLAWIFREPLRQRAFEQATLANEAPPPELVRDMIVRAADPREALLAAWNSGKIVHRQVAVRELSRLFDSNEPLPPDFQNLLLSASLDADMNVRESALSILATRHDPALPALAAAQLQDCDPQVRYLGLTHLKLMDANVGAPIVAGCLNDPEPRVVGLSAKLLERWSGESFGVKLSDTVQVADNQTGLLEYENEGVARTTTAAARARRWWADHQREFPAPDLRVPGDVRLDRRSVFADDFRLPTLDGRKVRLSDFRGKVVLLNFWTTWCTACVGEIPELIELQKRHGNELAILGISLDFIPDVHGHIGGHTTVEEQGHNNGRHDDDEINAAGLKRVREKVARTVKARKINYTVLLDEENEVGGRFNGGELPTTVIIDAEGFVRRRFVGARDQRTFEAMIQEASKPLTFVSASTEGP